MALALAWLLHRRNQILQQKSEAMHHYIEMNSHPESTAHGYRQKYPVKKAEFKNIETKDKMPMLLFLVQDDSQNELFENFQKEYRDRLSLLKLNCKKNPGCQQYFKVKELPAVLLFSVENKELGHFEKQFTTQEITELLTKKLKEASPKQKK